MRNRALATVAIIPLAALAACSGTPPQLTVSEAYVAERSEAGSIVHVTVSAHNPTPEPLAMWAVAYSTAGESVAGSRATINRWAQATAPAGGTVTFELPVVVTAAASGTGPVSVSGRVAYVPGNRLRELLNELDYPLPTAGFSATVPVDFAAPPRQPVALRAGTVRSAQVTDRGPAKPVDTLPPLMPAP